MEIGDYTLAGEFEIDISLLSFPTTLLLSITLFHTLLVLAYPTANNR